VIKCPKLWHTQDTVYAISGIEQGLSSGQPPFISLSDSEELLDLVFFDVGTYDAELPGNICSSCPDF